MLTLVRGPRVGVAAAAVATPPPHMVQPNQNDLLWTPLFGCYCCGGVAEWWCGGRMPGSVCVFWCGDGLPTS